ncbi:MAG: hypothetical protein H6732_18545 [Alphaproteobacteria bacterium]|nr:hypothetical protein [Alphaproteobacteria bacterium]
MADRLAWVQTALLVGALAGVGALHLRVSALEDELAARPAPPQATVARAEPAPKPARSVPPAPGFAPPPPSGHAAATQAAPHGAPAAALDDHLWSEQGRAAIDDVVAQREAQEREQMRSRFQQMMAYRTERAVEAVGDELDLSAAEAEGLRALVSGYLEQRGERWRQMHEGEVDVPKLQAEADAAREAFEKEVTTRFGEEGLDALREAMERGRGF